MTKRKGKRLSKRGPLRRDSVSDRKVTRTSQREGLVPNIVLKMWIWCDVESAYSNAFNEVGKGGIKESDSSGSRPFLTPTRCLLIEQGMCQFHDALRRRGFRYLDNRTSGSGKYWFKTNHPIDAKGSPWKMFNWKKVTIYNNGATQRLTNKNDSKH